MLELFKTNVILDYILIYWLLNDVLLSCSAVFSEEALTKCIKHKTNLVIFNNRTMNLIELNYLFYQNLFQSCHQLAVGTLNFHNENATARNASSRQHLKKNLILTLQHL